MSKERLKRVMAHIEELEPGPLKEDLLWLLGRVHKLEEENEYLRKELTQWESSYH